MFLKENLETFRELRNIAQRIPFYSILPLNETLKFLKHLHRPERVRFWMLMDSTVTSAGARLLESYLSSPERNLKEIHRRQSCVLEFSRAPGAVEEVASILKTGSDLESEF